MAQLTSFLSRITLWSKQWFKQQNKIHLLAYIIVFIIIFYSHAVNLFQYPYYENDEGTYMSQAWAIVKENRLAPYTYWYDHAPFGWMFIAFFTYLVGGFYTFGTAIDTGRVFMLILHLISCLLIIKIIKKATGNIWAGFASVLFFSLLPLANYFQRRVLLDNLLVFWTILALYFVTENKLKIRNVIISAVLLALAILSKESGVFFVPAFLYLVYSGLAPRQRLIGLFSWLGFLGSVIALYPILAILKTELLPSSDKVSLLETITYQTSRGRVQAFFENGSDFMKSVTDWLDKDLHSPYILLITLIAASILYLFQFRNRFFTGCMILAYGYLYFLIRGRLVLEFYIAPAFAVGAILFALLFDTIFKLFNKMYDWRLISHNIRISLQALIFTITLVSLIILQFFVNPIALVKDETTMYKNAVNWLRQNVDSDAKIIIDCGVWLEMRDSQNGREKVFKNADWYWKADLDPEIKTLKLQDNPENIDYIFATFQYYVDMKAGSIPFNEKALHESKQVIDFSQNGITATIFQVIKNKKSILNNTWQNYKKNFITDSGQVIDKSSNKTTSEGQSYALLRSVWIDDQSSFDKIWQWTKTNLQIRKSDKLLAWQLKSDNNGKYSILDTENATDGDLDAALALLLASKRWQNDSIKQKSYEDQAREIVQDIWKQRVVTIGDKLALLPFTSQKDKNYEILNPSYFSPAHYRMFSELDKNNNWNNLAFDSYSILEEMQKNRILIPNWIKFNYKTNSFEDATSISGNEAENYGYDAFRVFWRAGLDYKWYKRGEALNFLGRNKDFFEKEFNEKKTVAASYDKNGKRIEDYESTATDSAVQRVLELTNSTSAGRFWQSKFIERIDLKTGLFDSDNNYYNQNWGWITFADKEGLVVNEFQDKK
jgi:endo-1,4-beta-D-glucanase Y/4-amino-4-deoxy-L-arabinose transferase-like glycosyltransferase